MACLVYGDALSLLFGRDLVLFLQTTDYAIDGIHEVFTGDELLLGTSCD